MSKYDIYTFILCLIVFLSLTALFTFFIVTLIRLWLRLIRGGQEDGAILKEYREQMNQKKRIRFSDVLGMCTSAVLLIALLASFVFSIYLQATDSKAANGVPSLKVVKSASMSFADEKNTYLADNEITNHLQTFDLILTEHLPDEFDLQLYDVVVYEQNGEMVIHRIVGIEEPNEKHPTCRHFLLQGDAVQFPDSFPVLYSQMRGIWTGLRIPFVGSFALFMQSPAGWLCIFLIFAAVIVTPIAEAKLKKAKRERLQCLLAGKGALSVQSPVYVTVRKTPVPFDLEGIWLSHFRLSLTLQRKDPKLEFKVHRSKRLLKQHQNRKK